MLAILLMVSTAFASNLDCFPKDQAHIDMRIKADGASGISKASFDAAISEVETKWGPIVAKDNAVLQINNLWDDGTINSQAYQTEKGGKLVMQIDAFGGLARYPGMTKAGYVEVLCHELGHHLGGAPRYGANSEWAATEGQADYWATLNCMKSLGRDSHNGSIALAKTLASLGGEPVPSAATPDTNVVKRTNENHPEAQCRLDTYNAGHDCTADGNSSMSDPKVGTCYAYPAGKAGVGDRPLCWFKP